jgi:hypothetical protein
MIERIYFYSISFCQMLFFVYDLPHVDERLSAKHIYYGNDMLGMAGGILAGARAVIMDIAV